MNPKTILWILPCFVLACSDDEEPAMESAASVRGDGSVAECAPIPSSKRPNAMGCEPAADDYAPCTDDGYPACISDDGEYHRVQETISAIGRVRAFEEIGELLFDPKRDAAPDDFLQARLLYQEDEGLDSRVVRRYDPHVQAPQGTDCTREGVPAMYPEYCVGPSTLLPQLLEAFDKGITGQAPREQAGRIEGLLLWFFYVSVYKESVTCENTARDCDSAYAKYTGGEEARGGIGLGGRVRAVDPYAHDRAWDALLALRCWRDLDDGEVAQDRELAARARKQLDRALDDGVAAVVKQGFEKLAKTSGDERSYHFGFVTTLGRSLQRAMRERSASDAGRLERELERAQLEDIVSDAAIEALDDMFECP